ncbi:MAG: RNA polymerase sigma factor [Pseudomonadota bacterium]
MRRADRIVEEYLVISAQMGNRDALERLVALRGPRLLAHASRLMGNKEEARDVLQDAWIDIIRGLPKLADPRAFPAWATRIMTRRCSKAIRNNVRSRELKREFGATAEHISVYDDDWSADAAAVRRAIACLPAAQNAAIALFYLEEMSVAEVSVALDIPVGTVKTRLMHAREKLKATLTDAGETDDQAR